MSAFERPAGARPADLATTACTHPWVSHARVATLQASPPGLAVWLNDHGVAYLLRHGRADLLAVLYAHCDASQAPHHAMPRAWRLFDHDSPVPHGQAFDAEIVRPPPTEPWLLGEHATPAGHAFELKLPLDLTLFDDHFRSAPVVPGVMQVAWALAFGSRRYGPMACGTMHAVKFRRLVRPGDRLQLELAPDAARGRLDFTIRIGDVLCSSARLHVVQTEGAGHAR